MATITNILCTNNIEIDLQSNGSIINIGTSDTGGETIGVGNQNSTTAVGIYAGSGGIYQATTGMVYIHGNNSVSLQCGASSSTDILSLMGGNSASGPILSIWDDFIDSSFVEIGNNSVTKLIVNLGSTLSDPAQQCNVNVSNTNANSAIVLNYGSGGGITVPAFTNYGVIATNNSGLLSEIASGTSGYVLTSTGTSSLPSWQAASGGGFVWNNVTGPAQTMASGNGYISNDGATLVTFTLPATSAIGDVLEIQGVGTGLWTIVQLSGQTISFNQVISTSGITGSVSSTSKFDAIKLICTAANTAWVVNQATGNFSVV